MFISNLNFCGLFCQLFLHCISLLRLWGPFMLHLECRSTKSSTIFFCYSDVVQEKTEGIRIFSFESKKRNTGILVFPKLFPSLADDRILCQTGLRGRIKPPPFRLIGGQMTLSGDLDLYHEWPSRPTTKGFLGLCQRPLSCLRMDSEYAKYLIIFLRTCVLCVPPNGLNGKVSDECIYF